jgi:hypothetical protein
LREGIQGVIPYFVIERGTHPSLRPVDDGVPGRVVEVDRGACREEQKNSFETNTCTRNDESRGSALPVPSPPRAHCALTNMSFLAELEVPGIL